jgi:[ribosomal protein S5]-alanine N-acetyltransferase
VIETFETTRLRAERLDAGHVAELCRMHQDKRVMATLGGIRSDLETRRFLETNLEHWQRHGYGLWVFRTRADGRFVARGGLRQVTVGGALEVELAYALMSEHWGQGLATEMSRSIIALGFEQLGLANIVGFTLTTNQGSRRVLEKTGFTYERDLIHADLPHLLYRQRRLLDCHPS